MPVLITLNELQGRMYENIDTDQVGEKVSRVTAEILKSSPMLVADASNNAVPRVQLEREIVRTLDRLRLNEGISRDELIEKVFDTLFGYGPLQKFIEDEDVSDIDGTAFNEFSVVRNGQAFRENISFGSEEHFNRFCHLVAIRNYGILNENDPHCRVCDDRNRLRINISIPPRNISGSCINIRKHRKDSYSIEQLVQLGMLKQECADFLLRCAKCGVNVVFGGHGGSGKTTLLRSLINAKPEMERVLICESDSEIFPDKPFCIVQRIKRSNEGGRIYTLADIVRDGLTMRVETYVIGEAVSYEAWEGLKAAHSGHSFMTTTHAMNGEECLERLVLLSKSGGIPESEESVCQVAGKALDLVVFLRKFKVVEILEVMGYQEGRFMFRQLFGEDGLMENPNGRLSEKLKRGGAYPCI